MASVLDFVLIDGVEMNLHHPKTFIIPDATSKQSLSIGDYVKIGITSPIKNDGRHGERVWVCIEDIQGDIFYGSLANDLTQDWELPELIEFQSEHILNIDRG